MTKSGLTIKALASLVLALALCSIAQAQSRVFVSGVGDDLNPCTRTAPCRTFQHGHDVVAAGGEVVALDPGGFGTLTITKSVTITGEGVYAGITLSSAGTSISINSATAVVVLRNLSINGLGIGQLGIRVVDAAAVHVENCAIQGFIQNGLLVVFGANAGMETFVKDTVMRNNASNDIAAGKAVFENCRFENNTNGLQVSNGAKATVHNCVLAGNSSIGFGTAGAGSQAMVDNCQISNNGVGIRTQSNAQIRVSNSNITNNTTGLSVATAGTILSRTSPGGGTNTVEDNGTDGAFTGLYSAK
jgi:hypothetical protein